jgi:hypothetical protein
MGIVDLKTFAAMVERSVPVTGHLRRTSRAMPDSRRA